MAKDLSCRNCGNTDTLDSNFCSHCSQKTNLKLNNVGRMFANFAANIIDYDSKLLSSIRGLFYPGFLTNEYLAFKRVHYLTPIRLFVFLMFACFFILSWRGYDSFMLNTHENGVSMDVEQGSQINENNYKFLEKSSPKIKILSLIGSLVQELEKQKNTLQKLSNKDLDNQNEEAKKTRVKKLDIVYSSLDALKSLKKSSEFDESDNIDIKLFNKNYKVEIADVNTLSAQQLIDKYQVESWIEKLVVENFVQFNQDSNGFGKFIFQNLIWVAILDVLLMSLVFKLFYFRARRLYVEHFIFHLHNRAFIFFIGIVVLLIPFSVNLWVFIVLAVTLLLYLYSALSRVYKQSTTMTMLKFIVFGVLELFILVLAFVVVLLVSSLLFKYF